jgi:hypothetical protein
MFANHGALVVVVYETPDSQKPGHIAIVRPSEKSICGWRKADLRSFRPSAELHQHIREDRLPRAFGGVAGWSALLHASIGTVAVTCGQLSVVPARGDVC